MPSAMDGLLAFFLPGTLPHSLIGFKKAVHRGYDTLEKALSVMHLAGLADPKIFQDLENRSEVSIMTAIWMHQMKIFLILQSVLKMRSKRMEQ
ncbi:hypothetical protein BaRGS_00007062 [Batillaria attramentaria]|uniref:Uncharacterized protein n=1 Tax=Batillaria attramentaria TaxID=370345 RepID=A0ABD0LR50_9CAEN